MQVDIEKRQKFSLAILGNQMNECYQDEDGSTVGFINDKGCKFFSSMKFDHCIKVEGFSHRWCILNCFRGVGILKLDNLWTGYTYQ